MKQGVAWVRGASRWIDRTKPSHVRIVFTGAIVTYLVLTAVMAVVKRPWVDEAWFAIPANNLLTRGYMGTTNLETAGTWLVGLDRYTYWIMPLNIVAQAVWYSVTGFGILQMRALSIVWGLVSLVAWYVIVVRLTGRRAAALATMCLIAVDYLIIRGAADGRMDMMNAALSAVGIAAYLSLRHGPLWKALAVAHAAVAASVLTHPNGLLACAGLLVLAAWFDRRRVGLRELLATAAPYVVALAAWGLYILQAPDLFLTQFGGNASDREWRSLPVSWMLELFETYSVTFGFADHWAGPLVRVRALILMAYVAGVAGVLLTPALRRHRGTRALIVLLGLYFVLMPLLRSANSHDYLVHIIPMYAAALATWATWAWQHRQVPRALIGATLAGLVLLQVGGVAQRARVNTFRNHYEPVVEFLKQHAEPDDVVMGSAELGFALGFTPRLVDDTRLGYHSGRQAEFIVVDDRYRDWFDDFVEEHPDISRHVSQVLGGCAAVYDRNNYQIYECRQHNWEASFRP